MELIGILYAVMTVLAWGACLAPSQKVGLPNSQARALYIALGSLILAAIALAVVGINKLSGQIFLLPFFGGLIWAVSGLCAFVATQHIGMGKGGTIAQLCVVVNALVGIFLFKEPPPKSRAAALTFVGVVITMVGAIALGNIKGL